MDSPHAPVERPRLVSTTEQVGADAADAGEHALVEEARRGCHTAFTCLVERHRGAAYRRACALAGADDADDVTQAAFVKAFRGLRHFRRGAPFRPWLLAIVTNEARDVHRASQRRNSLATRAAARLGRADVDADGGPPVHDRLWLLQGLAQLPHRHRETVVCRLLLDLSELETAELLGVPAGTIKSRLSRGLDQLRRQLPEAESAA